MCDFNHLHHLRDRAMGGEDSDEDGEDERGKPKPAAESSSGSEGDVSDGGANSDGVSTVLSKI